MWGFLTQIRRCWVLLIWKWWVPWKMWVLKKRKFCSSLLRSDCISSQCHHCVPKNCSNFPKWCMFMKANVLLEVESVWNDILLLLCVWYNLQFFDFIRKRVKHALVWSKEILLIMNWPCALFLFKFYDTMWVCCD